MSQENVEAVREIFRGWSRGDYAVGADLFDPDIEYVSEFGVDCVTARGVEQMRRAWSDHLRNWGVWRTGDIRELRDLGEDVLVVGPVHASGRKSGVEVTMPAVASVFRFREGRIVWMLFTDQMDTALEAVGLRG